MRDSEHAITIQNLSKFYGKLEALTIAVGFVFVTVWLFKIGYELRT